eukprot:4944854-Amphidinium_carterae.1
MTKYLQNFLATADAQQAAVSYCALEVGMHDDLHDTVQNAVPQPLALRIFEKALCKYWLGSCFLCALGQCFMVTSLCPFSDPFASRLIQLLNPAMYVGCLCASHNTCLRAGTGHLPIH